MFWHKLFGSSKSESDERIATQSEFPFVTELKPMCVLAEVLPACPEPAPSLQNDLGPILRLGRVTLCAEVRKHLSGQDLLNALLNHMQGIWGGVEFDDHYHFSPAQLDGKIVCASYQSRSGLVFSVVTERDRSQTTVYMTGDEY